MSPFTKKSTLTCTNFETHIFLILKERHSCKSHCNLCLYKFHVVGWLQLMPVEDPTFCDIYSSFFLWLVAWSLAVIFQPSMPHSRELCHYFYHAFALNSWHGLGATLSEWGDCLTEQTRKTCLQWSATVCSCLDSLELS